MKYLLLMITLLWTGTALAQKGSLTVTERSITIPPAIEAPAATKPQDGVYYYAFQQGDVVLVQVSPEQPGRLLNLEVQEYASGSVIYAAKGQKKIKDLRFSVPQKAVYRFVLRSANGNPIAAQLNIKRLPEDEGKRHFNPNITWQSRHDTTWATTTEKVAVKGELVPTTLVDKTFRVASKTNLSPSRIAVPFKLPANTTHWVYWIGVGQEPVKELQNMTGLVTKGAAALASTVSPVAAFGLGLLPNLPQVKSSGSIDYYFMNKASADKFVADTGTGWKPYAFGQGSGILSDYKLVPVAQTPRPADGTLYAVFHNSHILTGLDVTLKVVAFTQEKQYTTRQVRKPLKIDTYQVPIF